MRYIHLSFMAMVWSVAATMASATISCDIAASAAVLRDLPTQAGRALVEIPSGHVVSLFDDTGDRVGAWVRVAYDSGQAASWGSGVQGWLRRSDLNECG